MEELIENIDYLIVSRDFPCRLMAEDDLKRALHKMQLRYGCLLAAATLGPGGVLAWDGRRAYYRPAYRVPVVDTTGAGDLFAAGFLTGLVRDMPLPECARLGALAAAEIIQHYGARPQADLKALAAQSGFEL